MSIKFHLTLGILPGYAWQPAYCGPWLWVGPSVDAGCIGGDYYLTPGACGSGGSSDVNGDSVVDMFDLTLMSGNYTFKEFQATQSPDDAHLIMQAQLETENGLTLMASDTPNWMEYRPGTNISISLSGDNKAVLF